MLEATLERRLKFGVERLGGRARKLPAHLYKGIPDRGLFYPTALLHFVELKKPRGSRFEHNQETKHAQLRAMGFRVFVLYTPEQVDDYLAQTARVIEARRSVWQHLEKLQ